MEWLLVITLLLLLWFWWDGSGAREVAVRQAKSLCQQSNVMFLDDSVVLKHIRLRRMKSGSLTFHRHFGFEFCTDGQQRYRGYVELMGKQVQATHMDVYRVADLD